MKVLVVAPELPYPLDQGGRIRTFHIIRELGKLGYEIDLVAASSDPLAPQYAEHLRQYCTVRAVVHHPTSRRREMVRLAYGVATGTPYVNLKFTPPGMAGVVEELVREVQYDVVLAEHEHVLDSVRNVRNVPVVADLHNVNSEFYRRVASTAPWGAKRVHSMLQYPITLRYERRMMRWVSSCVAVSDADGDLFSQITGCGDVRTVPNGVDTDFFDPSAAFGDGSADLVMTGSMDYHPNVDGINYFVREVLPLVRRTRPETRLDIAGRDPVESVRMLAVDDHINVTGAVPDVRPYLAAAKVVVVPIRMGSGTRLKALEAAAMGKPIVGTAVGLEGIDFTHGHDAVIADTPEEIARHILDLLEDEPRRRAMGRAARELASNRYSWTACVGVLDRLLQEIS